MTKHRFAVLAWTFLGAVVEGPIPAGHLYAMAMSVVSLEELQGVVSVLTDGGFLTSRSYLLTITEKGTKLFEDLDKVLEPIRKQKEG